jgi:small subunit ribosomal protein S6
LRTYELLFIAQPELDEENLNALIARVQQVILDHAGQVIKVEQMGRRRLAHTIRKRKEGYYVLIHAGLESAAMTELERSLTLSEDVLRYMLIRLEEIV